MSSSSFDWIKIAETAYDPVQDDQSWLGSVAGSVRAVLDRGRGLIAIALDPHGTSPMPQVRALFADDGCNYAAEFIQGLVRQPVCGELGQRFATAGPVASFVQTVRRPDCQQSEYVSALRQQGVRDYAYVLAGNPLGISCVFASPRGAPARLSPANVASMSYVAAHIAAAYRIRCQDWSAANHDSDRIEGILTPDGHLVHALPPAKPVEMRTMLARAARSMDRARGPLRRRDSQEAIRLWASLIAGRWSLIDHQESDGRRLLHAVRNDPASMPLPSLSVRESQVLALAALGHSNKLIGYELGLAGSTVAIYLRRVQERFEVRSRAALVRVLAQAVAASTPSGSAPVSPNPSASLATLTEVEREILHLIVSGRSNADIARSRCRSPRTIANQITSLFTKLNAQSRHELIARFASIPGLQI